MENSSDKDHLKMKLDKTISNLLEKDGKLIVL